MVRVRQIDEAKRVASLRTIAVLDLEPDELARRYDLAFSEAPSNLGPSLGALVETERAKQYLLVREIDSPLPGTEVRADETSRDPEGDLETLLGALDLTRDDVSWALTNDEAGDGSPTGSPPSSEDDGPGDSAPVAAPRRGPQLSLGGPLAPDEVVGRDEMIAELWNRLERQSVMLSGERRTGKTSMLRKMAAEHPPDRLAVYRNLEDVASPDDFVRRLVDDVRRLGRVIPSTRGGHWKDLARETFATLDDLPDRTAVLMWDELPQMLSNVAHEHGGLVGRELLDLLRATRERHSGLRMVFSGSGVLAYEVPAIGFADTLASINDMLLFDVPALTVADAKYLACQLLRSEAIPVVDEEAVAAEIVRETDGLPFYVHLAVHALREESHSALRPVSAQDVRWVIDQRIGDPDDPWQLRSDQDKLMAASGADGVLVKTILNALSTTVQPLAVSDLADRVAATDRHMSREAFFSVIDRLAHNNYLVCAEGRATFRHDFVRRAWKAHRLAGSLADDT